MAHLVLLQDDIRERYNNAYAPFILPLAEADTVHFDSHGDVIQHLENVRNALETLYSAGIQPIALRNALKADPGTTMKS